MKILEALQTQPLQINNGLRCLIGVDGKWIVKESNNYDTSSKTLIETGDEEEAVRVLMEGK